jgi:hypothetical protein
MLEEISKVKKEIQEYLEVRLDLIRLHTAENLSRMLTKAATGAVVGYISFLILLFLSFAAAYYLGSKWQSTELGFLGVALIYLLMLILFLIFKKHLIERPIIKAVVKLFFPKNTDDEK